MIEWMLEQSQEDNSDHKFELTNTATNEMRKFSTYAESIVFIKQISGEIKIDDEYTVGHIYLKDGEVIRYNSEHGIHDDFIAKHWCGYIEDEGDSEKRRLSIYDVYRESELL